MKKLFLFSLVLSLLAPLAALGGSAEAVYSAELDLFALFNDAHIKFYEERVAEEPVVSNISERRLARLADEHSVTPDKMKKVLIIQHAFKSQNKFYTIEEILGFKNAELVRHATEYVKYLKSTMSEEDFAQLVEDFKNVTTTPI
jgi:hypothetical protein